MVAHQHQRGRGEDTAQDVTYRWLKEYVSSLPRSEGAFVTEGELMDRGGSSRTPVREALLRLEAEGFLQILPKKGAFIPPVSDRDVETVMEARTLVEEWCVDRVARSDGAFCRELAALLEDQEGLAGDPVAFIEADRAFHRAVVAAAGNPVLLEFYESLRDRQVRMGLRAVAGSDDRVRRVVQEHRRIVAAVGAGDPEDARAAVAAHLAWTLEALRPPGAGRPR
ncbi:MAG TPA: GntR family transcriptional regulator [Acidimicrobiales bacterium]|nr:GntR family transcriptional regulator [Acidimicrobiales bacterium]